MARLDFNPIMSGNETGRHIPPRVPVPVDSEHARGPRPEDEADDLDRRNRVVIAIDHAVTAIGVIGCALCVAWTAMKLLGPLGLI